MKFACSPYVCLFSPGILVFLPQYKNIRLLLDHWPVLGVFPVFTQFAVEIPDNHCVRECGWTSAVVSQPFIHIFLTLVCLGKFLCYTHCESAIFFKGTSWKVFSQPFKPAGGEYWYFETQFSVEYSFKSPPAAALPISYLCAALLCIETVFYS